MRQVLRIATLLVIDFPGIARQFGTGRTIDLRQLSNRYFALVGPDIEIVVLAVEESEEISRDRVRDIAVGTLGRTIRPKCNITPPMHSVSQVSRQSVIIGPHTRTVIVKWPYDSNGHAMQRGEDVAQRFAETLRLVITSSWPKAGDIPTIALFRRNKLRIRIPIDLAGRKKQKSFQPIGIFVELQKSA